MNIVFRADASTIIGSGHVMRCLTLADALHKAGHTISFICRSYPGNLNDFISKKYDVHVLNFEYHQLYQNQIISDNYRQWLWVTPEQDAVETKRYLKSNKVDLLIIDHYALDIAWESPMRHFCKKIMAIDDVANRKHDCDILLDQNLQLQPNRYEDKVPRSCALLLGAEYALLRPEFLACQHHAKDKNKINNIFIFLGGSDLDNVTKKVLHAILGSQFSGTVNVLLGKNNPHVDGLKKEFFSCSCVSFFCDINNIAELMNLADLCIGAAGTTSWERCFLGLPTIMMTVAENQVLSARALASFNAAYYLGDAKSVSVHVLSAAINKFITNPRLLEEMAISSKKLVDGLGVERVLKRISKKNKESQTIFLRKAIAEDVQNLFDLRNHPAIRKNSFSSKPLILNEHQSWFYQSLQNQNRQILIAFDSKNKFIGVIRFDFTEDYAEVSIYVDPIFQGAGYGLTILNLGNEWVKENHSSKRIIAKVKIENTISHKLFLKAGFVQKKYYYEKNLEQTHCHC